MKTTVIRNNAAPIFESRRRMLLEIRIGFAAIALLELLLHLGR